jgi:uncharacterized membrane protein YtjA (UPF0391 family)
MPALPFGLVTDVHNSQGDYPRQKSNESFVFWTSQHRADDSPQEVQVPLVQKTGDSTKGNMLHYTLVFLVIALVAGALGFFGVAGLAASIAKILFVLFLVLFLVSLITGKRKI